MTENRSMDQAILDEVRELWKRDISEKMATR